MAVNTKVYEIILENERVADKILQNKQLIVEYDKKRQGNREALRELKKSEEINVWMTVGSILIEMERSKAIDVLLEGIKISTLVIKMQIISLKIFFAFHRAKED